MGKEQLDQFFRDKLQNRQFEFQEADWKEAEFLIEQQEAKKDKKRLFIWWWFLGIFLLLGISLGGYTLWKNYDSSNEDQTKRTTQVIVPDPMATEEGAATNKEAINKGQSALEAEQLSNVQNPSINPTINTPPTTAISADQSTNTKRSELIVDPTTNQNRQQKVAPPFKESNASGNKVLNENPTSSPLDTTKKSEAIVPVPPLEMLEKIQEDTTSLFQTAVATLNLWPTNTAGIDYEDYFEKQIIPRRKQKRLLYSLGIYSTVYPYPSDRSNPVVGFSAGMEMAYRLKGKWWLQSGLIYRHRVGTFSFTEESEVAQYRFGRSVETYRLRPSSLHYLELPVAISFKSRQHEIGLGVSLARLAGVRGEIVLVRLPEDVLTTSEPEVYDRGWISETGYKKWLVNLEARYTYQFHPRLAWSTKLSYTPGRIVNTLDDQPFEFSLEESNPFYLDIGFRVFF